MAHIGEAALDAGKLVSGMLRPGEGVGHAHVMREGEPARMLPLLAGEADGISIAVPFDEPLQLAAHRPRIHLQLVEQLVGRQIKRIHHAVLAFVDDPDRLAVRIQQLRAAVVAVDGVAEHERLIVRQLAAAAPCVRGAARVGQLFEMLERIGRYVFDPGEEAGIEIRRLHARCHDAAAEEADREGERAPLPGRNLHEQRARTAEPERQMLGMLRRQDAFHREAEAGPDPGIRSRDDRGAQALADAREEIAVIADPPHGAVRVVAFVTEECPARGIAAAVVDGQLGEYRRHEGGLQLFVRPGGRIRYGTHGRQDAERQVPCFPGILSRRQLALDSGPIERLQQRPVFFILFLHIVTGGLVAELSEEGQSLIIGSIPGLKANIDVLVGRTPKLQSKPSLGAGKTEREAGECSDRRMMSVVEPIVSHEWQPLSESDYFHRSMSVPLGDMVKSAGYLPKSRQRL